MGIIGIDPTGFIPEETRRRLYDSIIDGLARLFEKRPKGAEFWRNFRSDAAFRGEVDAAIERAIRRFVGEYPEIDREVLVALMRQPTPFWETPSMQDALGEMVRRPGTYLDPERQIVEGAFASVLPNFHPDRVNRAVAYFLSRLAEEVMTIPQLAPIYGMQLQRLSLEQGREMVAALRDLQTDQRQAMMALLEVLPRYPELPSGIQFALPEPPKVLHNLPQPDYGRFVGRDEELDRIHRLLKPYPESCYHIVAIDGIGGIGKTTLALEAAHRYQREYGELPSDERFAAIIWTSAKASVLTPDGIAPRQRIARTLDDIYATIAVTLEREDIIRSRPEEQDELVTKALSRQRTLLIVDNLETLDDEKISVLLRELPARTKAIVTSRHRIGLGYSVRLAGMPKKDGLKLIAKECEKKSVTMTDDEARRLFDHTGGVPLAVVWSVARMGYGHSVDAVLHRLSKPHEDLLHFCFAEALDGIQGTDAHKLLLALSVFHRDASREALCRVADLAESPHSLDEGLANLLKLSLVNKRGDRFWMLPLTRSYVTEQRAREQEPEFSADLRVKWAGYYERLLRQFEVGYEGAVDNTIDDYKLLGAELDNIFAVLEWCYATERWSQVASLVHLLCYYLYIRGLWAERERWIELGQEAARRGGDLLTEGMLLCDKAWVLSRQGDHPEAQKALQEARTIAQSISSDLLFRYAVLVEGDSARRQGNFEDAFEYFAEAAQGCGGESQRHLTRIDFYIGQVECDRGRLEEAEQRFQEVIERALSLGWQRAIAHAYLQRGQVALNREELPRAWEMAYERALPKLEEWKDEYELANCALLIGEIAEKMKRTQLAVYWTGRAFRVLAHQERKDREKAKQRLYDLGLSDEEIRELGVPAPYFDTE